MSNFIRLDQSDVQTILGLIDQIPQNERTASEEILWNKACAIAQLASQRQQKPQPELFRDLQTGRLTIQYGEKVSEPSGYKQITRVGNVFAVTDYYKDVFPTNVLLRFFHVNQSERSFGSNGVVK